MATTDPRKAARLLVRPSPFKGESLRGYLLRVGECNGLGNGAQLFRALTGKNYSDHQITAQDLEIIAHSLELSQSQVELMGYQSIEPGTRSKCLFFGHKIAAVHFRRRRLAVCPACLNGQNAISGLWDLSAVNACPHHGSMLISLCPSCGQAINWSRKHVSRCHCGFDLRQAETKSAPAEVLLQARLIYQRVTLDLPFLRNDVWDCPGWIEQISLNQLLSIIRFVTDVMSPSYPFEQDWCEDEARSGQTRSAVLFSEIIQGWPNGLWSVLIRYSDSIDTGLVMAASNFRARYSDVLKVAQRYEGLRIGLPEIFIKNLNNFLEKLRIRGYDRSLDLKITSFLNPSALERTSKGWVLKTKDATLPVDLEGEGGIYEKLWCEYAIE